MAAKPRREGNSPVTKGRKSASNAVLPAELAAKTLTVLVSQGNAGAASFAQRFFKTGFGQYGEGDKFLGIRVPVLRALVRDMKGVSLEVALSLLKSSWHEARAVALMLMVQLYQRGDAQTQKRIYGLYLKSTEFINNWDMVDLSAEHIVGSWLADKPAMRKKVLTRLAKTKSLWERRIAIIATFHYIKKGDAAETLRIATLLLKAEEDLIQRAVGWMPREVVKRVGEQEEETFVQCHYRDMPRTMLRYAIERFAEPKRKRYLAGLV